jgi:hypothetical protein
MDVTLGEIADIYEEGSDFAGTTYYCKECSEKDIW